MRGFLLATTGCLGEGASYATPHSPVTMSNPLDKRAYRRAVAEVRRLRPPCHICGEPGADSIDHIIPRKLRPDLAGDPANWAPAHLSCNSAKGARIRRAVALDW